MKTSELKLVVSFDSVSQTYKPDTHNLNAEQATDYVQNLHSEGMESRILEQQTQHRALNAEQCRPCQRAAELVSREYLRLQNPQVSV